MKRKLIAPGIFLILFVTAIWLTGSILSAPAKKTVGALPGDLTGQAVQFQSESGATIHGWFLPGRQGAGAVILLHGLRSNRLSMLDRARFLSHAGYSVLCFDFQAHGESSGNRITFGYLESRDAQAAVRFLRARVPGEKIGVIGVSMGGAATLLASPPLEVDAMALEMVYPTVDRAVSNRITMRLGNWASILTPLLTWQLKPRIGVGTEALRPIDHVKQLAVPKLFIVGSADQHTTLEESKNMFSLASEPKDLWIIEGAGHVDLYPIEKDRYENRILGFFDRYLRARNE